MELQKKKTLVRHSLKAEKKQTLEDRVVALESENAALKEKLSALTASVAAVKTTITLIDKSTLLK